MTLPDLLSQIAADVNESSLSLRVGKPGEEQKAINTSFIICILVLRTRCTCIFHLELLNGGASHLYLW